LRNTLAYAILAAVLGSVAGSFLNLVALRLPAGESIVRPPSHCPACGTAVLARDNVPVLGWLWLRGHCRSCGAAIAVRYPLVEALTGGLCVAVAVAGGSAAHVLLGFTLVLALVPIALIDLDHHLIPNRIVGPAAVAAVAFGSVFDPSGEPERLIAGAGAGAFFLLVAILAPRGMGMGDVKLAALLGLLLGREVIPAVFAAMVAGVVIGLVVLGRLPAGARRGAGVPFGPFLGLGAIVGYFAGHAILGAYLHHLA